MNIEEFYAANEARRASAEFEFGSEWTDSAGDLYELSWVETTGELYLMLGPAGAVSEDPIFGSLWHIDEPIGALTIKVIATIATHEAVEVALSGWADAMGQPGSLTWLAERFPPAENP